MIQLASSTELVFRVLMLRRHVIHRDLTTLVYRVECFLSFSLDPLVTLLSGHFTWGNIVSECDITFEWYRSYIHSYVHTCSFIYSRRFLTAAIANSCVSCWIATELCLEEEQRQRKISKGTSNLCCYWKQYNFMYWNLLPIIYWKLEESLRIHTYICWVNFSWRRSCSVQCQR